MYSSSLKFRFKVLRDRAARTSVELSRAEKVAQVGRTMVCNNKTVDLDRYAMVIPDVFECGALVWIFVVA